MNPVSLHSPQPYERTKPHAAPTELDDSFEASVAINVALLAELGWPPPGEDVFKVQGSRAQ